MNIKALKLVTGEDIIAEIEEKDKDVLILKNPVQVSMVPSRTGSQPTFGFIPFPLTSNDKQIEISLSHIMFVCDTAEEFEAQYDSLFGSGLIKPSSKIMV